MGEEPVVVGNPGALEGDKIIIAGVGSCGDTLKNLNPFVFEIEKRIESGVDLLGIRLGLQVLFEKSEESSGD